MSDVLKFVVDADARISDPDGLLMELPAWSEAVAEQIAADEGIDLTEDHWRAVKSLRNRYAGGASHRHARELTTFLEALMAGKGGRKYLYQLFPRGPVTQACKIAGLPVPSDSTDPGFGSVQ